MKNLSLLLCFAFASGPFLWAESAEELDRRLQRLAPDLIEATVAVLPGQGAGSGVIVSPDGLVLTAAHVTMKPGQEIKVLLSDGRELEATTLGVDHGTDAGMVQINGGGPFPWRPYSKESRYEVGDLVLATGHPGGPLVGRRPPVRMGRIRVAGRGSGFAEPITTTAMVISGDSGGPLWNLEGEVIGIHSNIAMSFSTNNHVAMDAFLESWDPLLKGEEIGQVEGDSADEYDLFDEPYAALRRRFVETLELQADEPVARELQRRPRLLDPHHMQELLDRWEPAEEVEDQDLSPWFGLSIDFRNSEEVRILKVAADGPAAKAGLRSGDVILEAGGRSLVHPNALAVLLATRETEDPVVLRLEDRKLELKPEMRPARGHFPNQVTGMIPMQVVGEGGPSARPEVLLGEELSGHAKELGEQSRSSVVALKKGGKVIGHATVVSLDGELLAKASELPEEGDLQSVHGVVERLAVDKDRDLALLRVEAENLKPVEWRDRAPRLASLLFTPLPEGTVTGVVTQKERSAPAAGYEADYTGRSSSVWLGVTLIPGESTAVVGRVEASSPADRAGVFEGDQILTVDGGKIEEAEDLRKRLRQRSSGEKIRLGLKREGKEKALDVILEERPSGQGRYSRQSAMRDESLSSLSARGGDLSERRDDFPLCLFHDQLLEPSECGSPVLDRNGFAVGINIARVFRHRTLAIPASEVQKSLEKMRKDR